MLNSILIITGGTINKDIIDKMCFQKYNYIVAVDGGVKIALDNDIRIDFAIGDFDTFNINKLNDALSNNKKQCNKIIKLNPEKDETDTEAAINLSLNLKPKNVTIIGGTGTRLDHTIANIHLLEIFLQHDIDAKIVDSNNIIRLVKNHCFIEKKEKYKYISILPYSEYVKGITLLGVKYGLENFDMNIHTKQSLGVSNEIQGDNAELSIKEGILLIIESCD